MKGIPELATGTVIRIFLIVLNGALDLIVAKINKYIH
jgi:hypothetical protein